MSDLLLRDDVEPNECDAHKKTALRWAVERRDAPAVDLLLQHKKTDPNRADGDNITPLHVAIFQRDGGIVKRLLSHPAIDPNLCTDSQCQLFCNELEGCSGSKTFFIETSLHIAVSQLYERGVRRLLEHPKVDPNALDEEGGTPLHGAVVEKSPRIITLLLTHSETDPNILDIQGYAPIHNGIRIREAWSEIKPDSRVLTPLLQDLRTDPNICDQRDNTPLHMAARWGDSLAVRLLLGHRKIKPYSKDEDGVLPIELLIRGYREIASETPQKRKYRDCYEAFFNYHVTVATCFIFAGEQKKLLEAGAGAVQTSVGSLPSEVLRIICGLMRPPSLDVVRKRGAKKPLAGPPLRKMARS
ncbi:MAG: ankyrin repeat domain-containing protein [Simkaniaceae bacterium]|nr:ankyrin repeat domain-containing protein [Candidatus Sacchlamyda saccharinae]